MVRTSVSSLAMLGGPRSVDAATRQPWPIVGPPEREAVLGVLASGKFTSAASGETQIPALEQEWAARVGTRHCVAVANGTIALSISLAAAGVQAGDEVIVPALSFVGSALAVAHIGAIPVFVDIDPVTFNIDPGALSGALSGRTAAVMPVHLHGLPADMEEVSGFARGNGLAIVEDAAQSHGVRYRDRVTGSIGDCGAFSLNVSKNLPTCGEGGLITTDDDKQADKITRMRQFGEWIPRSGERPYLSGILGWNGKMSAVQAAFTRAQLTRFDEWQAGRERVVRRFLDRVTPLSCFVPPTALDDRGHGWHILRFRIRPAAFELPPDHAETLRVTVMRALRAEGVPVSRYQSVPLCDQPVFADEGTAHRVTDVGTTRQVLADSFVLQHVHLNPDAGPALDSIADAMAKLWEHRTLISRMAADRHRADGRHPSPTNRRDSQ
jgi:perosamine synthetase